MKMGYKNYIIIKKSVETYMLPEINLKIKGT